MTYLAFSPSKFYVFLYALVALCLSICLQAQDIPSDLPLTPAERQKLDSVFQARKQQTESSESYKTEETTTPAVNTPKTKSQKTSTPPPSSIPESLPTDLPPNLKQTAEKLLQELLVRWQSGEFDEALIQAGITLNEHYTPEKMEAYVQANYGDLQKFEVLPNQPLAKNDEGFSFDYTIAAQFSKVPIPVKFRVGFNSVNGQVIFENLTFAEPPTAPTRELPDYREKPEPTTSKVPTETVEVPKPPVTKAPATTIEVPIPPVTKVPAATQQPLASNNPMDQIAKPFFDYLKAQNFSAIYGLCSSGFQKSVTYADFNNLMNTIYQAGNIDAYRLHEHRLNALNGTPVLQMMYLADKSQQINYIRLNYMETDAGHKLIGVYFNK